MPVNEFIVESAALMLFGELGNVVGRRLLPCHPMSRPFPAPTGHDAIAQGNALGISPRIFSSPEGARLCTGIRRGAFRGDGFRPFRAGNDFWDCTQGDALRYPILPRWGRTQGDALGVGTPTIAKP